MKTIISGILLISLITAGFILKTPTPSIELGTEIPMKEVKMKSIDGNQYSLNDLKKDNGLVVIFSCNTCPFVIAWEDRYSELKQICDNNKIGLVLINSNEAKRDGDDSFDNMVSHAKEMGYSDINYCLDNNHALADAFQATSTPHVFLFDGSLNLAYKGAIDDNYEDKEAVKSNYLQTAINSLASGEEIEVKSTKAIGCSIKRVKK